MITHPAGKLQRAVALIGAALDLVVDGGSARQSVLGVRAAKDAERIYE